MAERQPQYFSIPAGTPPSECRSCGQTVWWIETAAGRRMPVSVEVDGAFAPSDRRSTTQHDGSGISHFVDCPSRDQHRRPR